MDVHNIKIWPKYLEEILLGLKKVEIRQNDRNYKEGDLLILNGWCPLKKKYTGICTERKIDYIISGVPGLEPDYVILQISKPL
jgi:ASC-1-like (ASCH) protein